ncbi:MAG: PLP-dependent aminotransferase family protein [Chloroflexi bacterium]|nr:PLP-dependent aminotransferase family protein [Chloroflexota bacterium]
MPDPFDRLLSRRGRLSHPWSTVASQPRRPDLISFGGGVPDPASLPLAELQRAARTVLKAEGTEALQYGTTYGDWALQEELAKRHAVHPDQVMIATGASGALDALCAAFLDPGDIVLTEEPTFTGSLWTFRAHGAELVPVPVDEGGLNTQALRRLLRDLRSKGKQPKLVYTTPDFQTPTGTTLHPSRRQELVEIAAEHGCLLVEDTAYTDIRIEGESLPPLLSLGPDQTVQIGTFSKTIGPGLRVGWLLGAPGAVAAAARVRTDMGSSVLLGRILARFLAQGSLEPHLARVRELYGAKRDTLVAALTEHVGENGAWSVPTGGFFLWLRLRRELDARQLLPLAQKEGVSFIPGFRFLVEDRPLPALRLAFSQLPLAAIKEGGRRLGKALQRA